MLRPAHGGRTWLHNGGGRFAAQGISGSPGQPFAQKGLGFASGKGSGSQCLTGSRSSTPRGRPFGDQAAMAEPPPPLDQAQLDEISELITRSGGAVPLGKICNNCLGIKRAQLEGHFTMHRFGDQWQVHHPEWPGVGAPLPAAQLRQVARSTAIAPMVGALQPRSSTMPMGSSLRMGNGERHADADVPPLDAETCDGVTRLLEEAGGALPLGHVTQKFPGLKRLQLVDIFELDRVGENGQWEVRLSGVMPSGAELMFEGRAIAKSEPLPPLDDSIVESITSALELEPEFSLPMMKILEIAPGVKRQQLEQHFEIIRIDKKKFNVRLARSSFQPHLPQFARRAESLLQPQAPIEEVAPLDSDAVMQVTNLLLASGCSANLGKVSSMFKFIKRSQLEGHFELERVGDQWEVRIPAGGVGTAEKPPPRPFPAGNREPAFSPAASQQLRMSNFSRVQLPSRSHRIGLYGPGKAGHGPGLELSAVQPGGLHGGISGGPALPRGMLLPRPGGINSCPAPSQMQSAAGSFTYATAARGIGGVARPLTSSLTPPSGARRGGKGAQLVQLAGEVQPVAPLDPQILDKIESLVLESGGPVPMGKISSTFMGVKRAHLEEHFDLVRVGDQWIVSLSSPVKRQRLAL